MSQRAPWEPAREPPLPFNEGMQGKGKAGSKEGKPKPRGHHVGRSNP